MRRTFLTLCALLLVVALGACGGKGAAPRAQAAVGGVSASATPLDTSAIQTQTLAPADAGSAPATGRVIGATPPTNPTTTNAAPRANQNTQSAAEIGAAAAAALKAGAASTTPTKTPAAITPSATTPNATTPSAAPPKEPSSPEEAACIKDNGRWGRAGKSSAMACFYPSKDAGKSCSKESDCTSQCLARSRSCAPFWPIFGCTEVIQNDGAVVKLCLQ
ncbi:MAG: hypothetical protein U5N55_14045 [Cypionkella sp.]|nr:hypothetical protein [Cypionkella sp.]